MLGVGPVRLDLAEQRLLEEPHLTDVGVLAGLALGVDHDEAGLLGDVVQPRPVLAGHAGARVGGGASVLVIKDKASLNKRLGEMFTAKPLADLGKSNGKCPPAPPGFKQLPPAATATPKP